MDLSMESLMTWRTLWSILRRRGVFILLVVIVAVEGALIYTKVLVDPQYASTATVYLLRRDGQAVNVEPSDFSQALNVVEDCAYMMKSRTVLNKLIRQMELEMTWEELSQSITVTNPVNTRILEVTVQAGDPERAQEMADELCRVGMEHIADVMGFRQANQYEEASLPDEPSNKRGTPFYCLVGLTVAVLCYVLCLLEYMIKSQTHKVETMK